MHLQMMHSSRGSQPEYVMVKIMSNMFVQTVNFTVASLLGYPPLWSGEHELHMRLTVLQDNQSASTRHRTLFGHVIANRGINAAITPPLTGPGIEPGPFFYDKITDLRSAQTTKNAGMLPLHHPLVIY